MSRKLNDPSSDPGPSCCLLSLLLCSVPSMLNQSSLICVLKRLTRVKDLDFPLQTASRCEAQLDKVTARYTGLAVPVKPRRLQGKRILFLRRKCAVSWAQPNGCWSRLTKNSDLQTPSIFEYDCPGLTVATSGPGPVAPWLPGHLSRLKLHLGRGPSGSGSLQRQPKPNHEGP